METPQENPPAPFETQNPPAAETQNPPADAKIKTRQETARANGKKGGRPRKHPRPPAAPAADPAALGADSQSAADAIAATLEQNSRASTGSAAAPFLDVDAGGPPAGGTDVLDAPPVPDGVPAGEVASLAIESLDNLVHALRAEYCMTARERSTASRAADLMGAGRQLPAPLALVIALGSWILRVFLMRKFKALAMAAAPAAQAAAQAAAPAAPADDAPDQCPPGLRGLGL